MSFRPSPGETHNHGGKLKRNCDQTLKRIPLKKSACSDPHDAHRPAPSRACKHRSITTDHVADNRRTAIIGRRKKCPR